MAVVSSAWSARSLPRALVLLLLSAASAELQAQTVEPLATRSFSGNETLDGSLGAGLNVWIPIRNSLHFGGGLIIMRRSIEREAISCVRKVPQTYRGPTAGGCQTRQIEEEVTTRSIRMAVMPYRDIHPTLRASGAVGFSLNEVLAWSGDIPENEVSDIYTPSTANAGGYFRLQITYSPLDRVPAGAWLGTTRHWVNFEGCRTDYHFAPFCGLDSFTEVAAGLSVRLR